MSNWYVLSILALIFMGSQRFLYKVSAERGCSTAWTTFSFMATVTVLSVTALFLSGSPIHHTRMLILTASVNAGSFVIGTIAHMEALKHVSAGVVYPIIRLNAALVVLFSIFFFDDRLSVYQFVGILIALLVILILTRHVAEEKEAPQERPRRGIGFAFIALCAGSVAAISAKFAALYTHRLGFMAVSYFLGTVFAFGIRNRLGHSHNVSDPKEAFLIGLGMGLINFVGFYLFLAALSRGPLSIVISIVGLHFIIAIILSAIIYKERLSAQKIMGISLAVLSVFLLRL